jgi:hypothetical protein
MRADERDNSVMQGFSRRAWVLLVGGLLLIGAVTALSACGGSGRTTTVTTTVTKARGASVSVRARRQATRRRFRHDAATELQPLDICLADSGIGSPSLRPHDTYAGGPYASASIKTSSGSYEVAIFPTTEQASDYAFQQTSFAGAGSYAVHGSYLGRVALFSEALDDKGIANRGQESHAYYVERTAVARCAFSIPAATGQPTYVY